MFAAGVSGIMTLKMKPYEKQGVSYLSLEKLKFDIKVQRATINMNNLFNGNKELGESPIIFYNSPCHDSVANCPKQRGALGFDFNPNNGFLGGSIREATKSQCGS